MTSDAEFLRSLPIGVWIANAPGGELAYANAEFAEIMGMNARADVAAGGYTGPYGILDRTGKPFPEDRLPFPQVLEKRADVVVDDIVIRRPDGTSADVRAYGRPLFDASGTLTHVLVAFTDMTAEVAATREKELAQGRLRAAVEHAPVVLFTFDRKGVITLAEGSPLSRVERPDGGFVGHSIYELYANDPHIVSNMTRVLEGGETITSANTVSGRDFETWMSPMFGADGSLTGGIGVSTDVTERAAMQRKFLQTDRLVALGTLAAGVAHELNNPLTFVTESLSGIDDLMLLLREEIDRAGALPAVEKRLSRLQKYVAHAREGAERLRVITRELRSFSRVDEARHVFDVRIAAQSALHLVSRTLEGRARLATELHEVPLVHANEARIVQVVVNLLINAAQAIPDGAAVNDHEIRITTLEQDGCAILEVSDTGRGVPAEIRDRLFEPFFTTKAVDGTGLGLSISRDIVEALGGTISVGDRVGGGAVFRVRLPAASAEALAAAPPVAPRTRPSFSASRRKVLVVEDDPTLGELMRSALIGVCEVEVTRSVSGAVERIRETTWDLVLCDLMLGDGTAEELYDTVRRDLPGREHAFVFMTGGAFTDATRAFLRSVPNDRLQKPFDVLHEVRARLG